VRSQPNFSLNKNTDSDATKIGNAPSTIAEKSAALA
jgi:hypothetical protein